MIFPKKCYHQIVWKWINWRWMARLRILDQTSRSHVQFRKRRVIHVHWTWNGPEWRRCFVGINFLRGNNHVAGPKSPKYIFAERLAISLTYILAAKYNKCCAEILMQMYYPTEIHRSIRTPWKFVKAKNSFQISVLKHPL